MTMARYHSAPVGAAARHSQRPVSAVGAAAAAVVSLSIWVGVFFLVSSTIA